MMTEKRETMPSILLAFLVATLALAPCKISAASAFSTGQSIYLSVIPQVQPDGSRRTTYLGFLMTIRNTDRRHGVTIRSIAYHNADGETQKEILQQPFKLAPLASHALHFKEKDLAIPNGMSGCMIVEWDASQAVSPVLVEGVVIGSGTGWTTGLVFKGVVIEEKGGEQPGTVID